MAAKAFTASARWQSGDVTLLDNRYRLGELLGRGGMAEVRKGWDVRLHREVAVKLFQSHADEDEVARRRFTEEARTLACLSHPGLVTVYDVGVTQDDAPYLILHLVEGPTLRDRINDGPMPEDEVRAIGAQLADTLAHVHAHEITHRDVKPSNILLDAEGTPYLADFGIAKQADATSMTVTGEVVGTASYLAPEQVRGEETGFPVDIYALGLVLLECLTGRREYGGTEVESALARLTRPVNVPEDVSPELSTILQLMTALTPHRRPTAERCAELFRDPGQVLPAEKPTLVGEPVPVPVPPPQRHRKVAVAALSLVAAGAVALTLTRTTHPVDLPAPPQQPPPVTTSQPAAPPSPTQATAATTVVKTTTVQQRSAGKGKGSGKKPKNQGGED